MEMKIRDVLLLVVGLIVLGAIGMALPAQAAPGDPGVTGQTMVNRQWEARIDASAATSTRHYLWCPGVASTTLPAAGILEDAKSLSIHNNSSAGCAVEFDGSAVTTNGATGDWYAAGDRLSQDISGRTFGAYIRAACTAVTASPSCLKLRWWK
jgi:hypothetical protein